MKEKKRQKDSETKIDKQTVAKVARVMKSEERKLYSQESDLFLRFLAIYPQTVATSAAFEMLWSFLKWLRSEGIYLIDRKTIFCFPLERMIKLGNLK